MTVPILNRLLWCLGVIVAPVLSVSGQVQLTVRTNYYVVTGASLREIHRSMDASRPWGAASRKVGRTDWQINWQTSLAPSGNGCRLAALKVQATITVTVPVLRMMTNTPPEVIQTWQRFLGALMVHEQEHVQIARRAAAQVQSRVQGAGSAGDCTTLQSRINEVANKVLEECRQQQNTYDQRTRHGATQGVHLPHFLPGERPPHRRPAVL